MRDEWQETLNEMRGIVETHWDEVAEIMKLSDEEIIQFLSENSQKFQEASELQQEEYVRKWEKMCQAIHDAYKDTYDKIQSYDYSTIPMPEPQSTSSPSTNSNNVNGSSPNGGSPSNGGNQQLGGGSTTDTYYIYVNSTKQSGSYSTKAKAEEKAKFMRADGWVESGDDITVRNQLNTIFGHYKKGGLVNYTGPAWVDGSPNEPEAFLSAKQTSIIGDFAKLLERVMSPTFPALGYEASKSNDNNVTIETINVNVEKLDSDEDYEEIAAKVGEVLVRSIGRISSVGGMRMG